MDEETGVTSAWFGGGVWTRGQLYHLLKNVTYASRIGHKGASYPGQHPAIIEPATFDRVQALLASHVQGERTARAARPSLLAGKLVDEAGEPLISSHTAKRVQAGAACATATM